MRTLVLYGEYELTIDEKSRLLVPAEVRRSLDPERDGDTFFVVIGDNLRPWLYPEFGYETLVSKLATEMSPGEEKLAFDQLNFSMASRVGWDKQGRMLIPEGIRRRTELTRDVTMIGVRDHLELWNREAWQERRESLFANKLEDVERKKKLAVEVMKSSKGSGEAVSGSA